MPRTVDVVSNRDYPSGELDLRGVWVSVRRRRGSVVVWTLIGFMLAVAFVIIVPPKYQGESQVLLENQETFFTRPDRNATVSDQNNQVDAEAVGSQIQLITSRDLAARAIKDLNLRNEPEFEGSRGMSVTDIFSSLLGSSRGSSQDTLDTRTIQLFEDKLTVFSPTKTRVISIQFQSKNPDLAARVANKMADLYVAEQSSAKRTTAKQAADALSGQIADLRVKLANADAERERYRAATGLLAGNNNLTISGQQLADINSDLSKARTAQADAQAKASMIRDLLRSGKAADVTDVINNDLVRRVAEQRVTAQATLDLESRTLLPGHPRIKELSAQVAGLDAALRGAARQAETTLENEAKIAGQRVSNLENVLTQQKKVVGTSNGDEVRLRSLDRISQSYKDQLESSTTKYQEAIARESSPATPADARIITRATVPQEPVFPKKLPFIAFGTIAAFFLSAGFVVARELLSNPFGSDEEAVLLAPVAQGSSRAPAYRRPGLDPVRDRPAAAPSRRREEPKSDRDADRDDDGGSSRAPASQWRQDLAYERQRPDRAEQRTNPKWFDKVLGWELNGIGKGLKTFGQSAAESRAAPHEDYEAEQPEDLAFRDPRDSVPAYRERLDTSRLSRKPPEPIAASAVDVRSLTARIVSAHVPGRGLHLVGASLGSEPSATDELIDLSRALSDKGRSIIVDLNASPENLAELARRSGDLDREIGRLAGLSELLSGKASFAEVIHRDHASRLHFIPTGLHDADFRDFDLILDALSETYDFIVLLAPSFPGSEIAKVMAPYADFVVLTGAKDPNGQAVSYLEAELIEAGAHEVLVTGRSSANNGARKPDVA